MKTGLWGALVMAVVLAVGLAPSDAEAKRFGGGKSSGLQRNMPARTAPDAPPAKPAQPSQAGQAVPGTAGAAAAAPGKRSWMGPIAGLAAGLGIAALMSHLGMGEAFGNFLMLALLAVAAVFVIRLLMRRFAPQASQPSPVGANMARTSSPVQVAWPPAGGAPAAPAETPAAEAAGIQPASALSRAFVPAAFDSEGFERVAKMIFIRMQAANDSADLDDLRQFTTPEMFASLQLDLLDRGAKTQRTDVLSVQTQVLDVSEEGGRQVVSVNFKGQLREQADGDAVDFDEVWHLVKPVDDSRSWAIAGVEQLH